MVAAVKVLPRLISLPDNVASAAEKAAWKAQLQSLPPLPLVDAAPGKRQFNSQKVAPIATGNVSNIRRRGIL